MLTSTTQHLWAPLHFHLQSPAHRATPISPTFRSPAPLSLPYPHFQSLTSVPPPCPHLQTSAPWAPPCSSSSALGTPTPTPAPVTRCAPAEPHSPGRGAATAGAAVPGRARPADVRAAPGSRLKGPGPAGLRPGRWSSQLLRGSSRGPARYCLFGVAGTRLALAVTGADDELNEPPACLDASRRRGRAPSPGLSPESPAVGSSCLGCPLTGISAVPLTHSIARSHPRWSLNH